MEEQHCQIRLKEKEIKTRIQESLCTSTKYIEESKKVGIATGLQLQSQKEQLLKTEKHLDDIDNSLKSSKRHLSGMKSMLGGVYNSLFARKAQQTSTPQNGKSEIVNLLFSIKYDLTNTVTNVYGS